MGSVSSEDGSDQQSERCGSYNVSADVSESESSSSFTCRRYDGASSSLASSPLTTWNVGGKSAFPLQMPPPPSILFPVIGSKDALAWCGKPEKRELDLSGSYASLS